jgi:hypothetical protein
MRFSCRELADDRLDIAGGAVGDIWFLSRWVVIIIYPAWLAQPNLLSVNAGTKSTKSKYIEVEAEKGILARCKPDRGASINRWRRSPDWH